MKKIPHYLGVLLFLLVGLGLTAPEKNPADSSQTTNKPPEDELHVPEGLEVELWAEAPLMYNPTNIDVDKDGRIWVLETVDYRNFNNDPDNHLTHPKGERVVILEDTNGDGKADDSKVFVQDEDLVSPLGLAVIGNKVIVSAAPDIYVYTDTDGDDKADKRETFLSGFGGIDHDHGLHGITAGPDGRWYFNAGNAGPHIVTDQSGWTLRSGSIYSGGSPYMEDNQPGMVSDDGQVWVGGIQLRVNPDGTGLEVLADNFRNSYELAVDSYGNLWNNDNDDDGNEGTRVLYTMEGGNYGYFSQDGSRTWGADRRPNQETFEAHWHQEDPGVLPAGDASGPGAPTGIVLYESNKLGEKYRGTLLSADAGRNVIYGYHPEQKGAGFDLDRFSFFSTLPSSAVMNQETYNNWDPKDKSYYFRPSDVAVGTDGAIYVADWYDPRVGGHQMQEGKGYGRIYRITPEGENLQNPELDLSTTEGQIKALLNPAKNVRHLGFKRLKEQGSSVVSDVQKILDADNPYHQARAVWLLAQLGSEGVNALEEVLDFSDPQLRVAAFRALRQVKDQDEVLDYARQLKTDASPAVLREIAIFLRDVPLSQSKELMRELARRYNGDRWLLEAYGLAAEGEEAEVYQLLKAELGNAQPAAWSHKWADLVWRLHPVEAVDALKERASAVELDWEEKKQAMVALGFIKDQQAVEAMETLAESSNEKVAKRAQWWLDYRRTNMWHDLKDWQADKQSPEQQKALKEAKHLQTAVLDNSASTQKRVSAAQKMAETPEGGRLLMSLIIDEKISDELKEGVRKSLFKNPDRTVRVLANRFMEHPDAKTFDADDIADQESDNQHGQMLFYTKCATCHRVGQTGADVGPQLTGVKNMFNQTGLIKAILQPNSGIAHSYSPSQVRTKDGDVVYGFLLAENNATIVIKDVNGRKHVIDRDRVADRRQLEISLMPNPEELKLSDQDVADLAGFLQTYQEE